MERDEGVEHAPGRVDRPVVVRAVPVASAGLRRGVVARPVVHRRESRARVGFELRLCSRVVLSRRATVPAVEEPSVRERATRNDGGGTMTTPVAGAGGRTTA